VHLKKFCEQWDTSWIPYTVSRRLSFAEESITTTKLHSKDVFLTLTGLH